MSHLRRRWARSAWFRVALVAVAAYAALRLGVHSLYLSVMAAPERSTDAGLPAWADVEGPTAPVDLQVYLDAAERFRSREDLYLTGAVERLEDLYQYPPAFALASVPLLRLSPLTVSVVHTVLHIAAYVGLYLLWDRIFARQRLAKGQQMLAAILPLWVLYPDFWSDLGYLNIYVFMALLATLLIESVLTERLGWSVLWLSLILQTKPQWAAVAAAPLLLGRRRFFLQLLGLSVTAFAAVAGATALLAGPDYALEQYGDYAAFLTQLSGNFPWRGPDSGFLGYNHSVKQIAFYVFGLRPWVGGVATGVKVLLLAPLGIVGLGSVRSPLGRDEAAAPARGLDLTFALYLGAFIWLDVVWELTLGVAVFAYLLATVERRRWRALVWAVVLPYALVDVLRLLGGVLAFFGLNTVVPGPYVVTDPSMHVPMVMFVILIFYGILLRRLWPFGVLEGARARGKWTVKAS